jgi:hypothetical protein
MAGGWRQFRQPREFRIAAPPRGARRKSVEDALEVALALEARRANAAAAGSPAPRASGGGEPSAGERPAPAAAPRGEEVSFLADLCTALFRLKASMLERGTDRPREEVRRSWRHLQTGLDVLAQAGVEIRDHAGEPLPEGDLALRIATFESVPGLDRPRVVETLRPSVYWRDRCLQTGEVVVGRPDGNAAAGANAAGDAPAVPTPKATS